MQDSNDLKNITISGVMWKGLERVAAQLVSVIVSIILARILIPDDYSVVSIVTIFFAFCSIFISGGLNTALVQKKDADMVDYSTILYTNLAMALFFYFVLFFCAPTIATFFQKDLLVPVIRVMGLTFFINGYKAVVSAKITSDMRFRQFFWSTLVGTVISAVFGIYMALRGFGPWALVAQQMINSFIDAVILTFSSRIRFYLVFSWKRFKRLFGFGGKVLLSSIINQIYNQANPLIVGIKYSTVDLAYFNKGKTYPELIAYIGNDTLSSSLFPALSKVQDDKDTLLIMVRRFMQLSSFVVFPMMFGFFAISENFVRVVLTEKWMPIVPYLMIFCISYMFKPIQTGNLQAIRAIGRSDVVLKLEIVKNITFLITILMFILFTDSPVLLAVSGIVTSLLACVILSVPNQRLLGYSNLKQLQDIGLNFIVSAIMGTAVYFMKYLPFNPFVLIVLQIIAGIILYIGVNLVFKNKCLFYSIKTVRGFLKKEQD